MLYRLLRSNIVEVEVEVILFLTRKQMKDYNFARENGGFYNLLIIE